MIWHNLRVQEDAKAEPWCYLSLSCLALEAGAWDIGTRTVEASVVLGGIRVEQKQEQELNSHYFLNRSDQRKIFI